jgi:hypothetical protein
MPYPIGIEVSPHDLAAIVDPARVSFKGSGEIDRSVDASTIEETMTVARGGGREVS